MSAPLTDDLIARLQGIAASMHKLYDDAPGADDVIRLERLDDFADDIDALIQAAAEALAAASRPTQELQDKADAYDRIMAGYDQWDADRRASAPSAAPPPDWQTAALLKERTRRAIRERVAAGEPVAEAAYDYGVPVAFVDHLVQWELFKEELPAAPPPWQPIETHYEHLVCQTFGLLQEALGFDNIGDDLDDLPIHIAELLKRVRRDGSIA